MLAKKHESSEPNKALSNSSAKIKWSDRIRGLYDLFQMYRAGGAYADKSELQGDFLQIDDNTKVYLGKSFVDCHAVEVGFGAKPYRIQYFCARGVNVYGFDLDMLVVKGTLVEILKIAQRNGLYRALKTGFRFLLFDRPAREEFKRFLGTVSGDSNSFDQNRTHRW